MVLQGQIFWIALPLFLGLVLIEAGIYWWLGRPAYTWRESLASIGVGIGHKLIGMIKVGAGGGVAYYIWQHRLTEVPLGTWWGVLALFLGVEFAYYWFHRFSHEIRWMWASHAVHHSARHLNILAAYRLGWTGFLSGGWVLYMPLVWIGFHPAAVFLTLSLNLLYQTWIHTGLIPKLGWLEYVLNTPSNHRVHHATNADYLDRNYGGVLIVFDRLFGTYVEERDSEPCLYGLVKPVGSDNPLRIAFHEWIDMGRDALRARSLRELTGYLFGRPGWKPDGSGLTSEEIRRAWRERNAQTAFVSVRTASTAAGRSLLRRLVQMAVATLAIVAAIASYATAKVPASVRSACQSDYRTYCPSVLPGGGRILACMRENQGKLSPACVAALKETGSSGRGATALKR